MGVIRQGGTAFIRRGGRLVESLRDADLRVDALTDRQKETEQEQRLAGIPTAQVRVRIHQRAPLSATLLVAPLGARVPGRWWEIPPPVDIPQPSFADVRRTRVVL